MKQPPEQGEPKSATTIWWRDLLFLITALSALLLVIVLIIGSALWVMIVIGASVYGALADIGTPIMTSYMQGPRGLTEQRS